MSLLDILRRREEVIKAMILYEMEENNVLRVQHWDEFINTTYRILAEVQVRKGNF